MSTNIFLCPQIYFYAHKYIFMSTNIFLCPQIYFLVHKYIFMSTNIFLCPQIFFLAHKYFFSPQIYVLAHKYFDIQHIHFYIQYCNAWHAIIEYQKPLSNFTLNDMNMFERTHAFFPDRFIRHYSKLLFFVN